LRTATQIALAGAAAPVFQLEGSNAQPPEEGIAAGLPGASPNLPTAPNMAPKPFKPVILIPSAQTIVKHFCERLITPPEIEMLKEAKTAIQRELQIRMTHSPSVIAEKVSQAVKDYAAEPSAKNLKALRELRSLDVWDHGHIQFYAEQRKAKVQAEKVSPIAVLVHQRAADLLEAIAQEIRNHDAGAYENWGFEPVDSPLVTGLLKAARNFRGVTGSGGDVLPDLLQAILDYEPAGK